MANGINLCVFSGHVGTDAELKYTANGIATAQFSLAVGQSYKKGDEWVDDTLWLKVILWRETAERLTPELEKGTPVLVEGKLQIRTWNKDDGTKQYFTEVVANRVQIFGRRPKKDGQDGTGNFTPSASSFDDLPFE